MKRIVLAAAAAVALFGAPALAMDSMMGHDAKGATMLCRPAAAGEKPTAMMGAKGIVCKPTSSMMMKGHRMGPDTKGMNAAQTDAAWRKWIEDAMLIQSAGTTPGG